MYKIVVSQLLAHTWNEWFDGLTLWPLADGTTLLTRGFDDPAALHAVLNNIHKLNMDLIYVSSEERPAESKPNSRGG